MRWLLALCLCASSVHAGAPDISLRPAPRPEIIRPPSPAIRHALGPSGHAVTISPRPEPRPENLRRRATVRAQGTRLVPPTPAGGSVCGLPAIKGERIAAIPGRIPAYGIADPVRITSVAGLRLSQAAIMDCTTAKALNTWAENGVKPAMGRLGGGVTGLRVAAHYVCRTRNHQPNAKVSEHGRGRAVDISAIELANGQSLTVLRGWRDRDHGRRLKAMHAAACGPFGTVLGPDSDRFHQDHFHFDTARYRSGPYCR